jgi:hypothetical protein
MSGQAASASWSSLIRYLVLPAVACSQGPGSRPTGPTILLDAEVYRAALETIFVHVTDMSAVNQIVLVDSSLASAEYSIDGWVLVQSLLGIDASTLQDLRTRNDASISLRGLAAAMNGRLSFAGDREFEQFATGGPDEFWVNFYERFPGATGLTRLSRVGYGNQGRQAALLVQHSCAPLCDSLRAVLLEKADSGWRVVRMAARSLFDP